MMKKNKGFTMLELMIAIAIFSILVTMMAPMFRSITRANKRTQELVKLDLNIGRSVSVFKRAVNSSKGRSDEKDEFGNTTGRAIYISDSIGEIKGTGTGTSSAIVINVPTIEDPNLTIPVYKDEKVLFYFAGTKLMVDSTNATSGAIEAGGVSEPNPTVLVENVIVKDKNNKTQSFF